MSNAIQTTNGATDMGAIEQVLVGGDLSKLTAAQRVSYYNKVCESIGVNPFTRPFEYIVLNSKLQLYARKDCTDQLRSSRKASIEIVNKEKIDDVYVVTARATLADGRKDEATGAVNLQGLRGEALANALMKAETKAKRRVTLSICGLGFADESEIDSIPGARVVTVDQATGEVLDPIAVATLPDFAALIEGAATADELKAIAKDIESARKAGSIGPDVRKVLADAFVAKQKALTATVAA